MTEWELQQLLTSRWLSTGVDLDGERLLLAAWEVMLPSWKINDATRQWNEPSIDFVAVDELGHLVAIELKTKITGIQPVWAVLCQVTHRALMMSRTVTADRLIAAHDACMAGEHGRVSATRATSLRERHQRLFNRPTPLEQPRVSVRRVVAAAGFGKSYDAVVNEFNTQGVAAVLDRPSTRSKRLLREIDRIRAELPIHNRELAGQVEYLREPEPGC